MVAAAVMATATVAATVTAPRIPRRTTRRVTPTVISSTSRRVFWTSAPVTAGPGTEGPPGDETCSDGIDNDEDGDTDQEDSDCQEPEGPPGDETCSDGIDNDGDGATDEEDSDCQNGGGGDEPTCGDPDGDGVDHSAFDPDSNEGGLVSSIVHGVDQALPSPVGGDQGVVTEVNCAIVVTVEEILGING